MWFSNSSAFQAVLKTRCTVHQVPPGVPCYSIQSASDADHYLAGICNHRINLATKWAGNI